MDKRPSDWVALAITAIACIMLGIGISAGGLRALLEAAL